jgi:hypothetical protein
VLGGYQLGRLRGHGVILLPLHQRCRFNTLVGTWDIEATHPMFPSTVVHGTAEFEWET